MNTKELNELIVHYLIESKLKNAILINGTWGSGKTYYVQNELFEVIKNTRIDPKKSLVPIYVSLYGVASLSDISKEIFNKTVLFGKTVNYSFKKSRFIGGKARKRFAWDMTKGTTKSLVKGLLTKHLGFEFSLPKVHDYWKYLDDKEIVLILDDLERSRIDLVELLGYINNFVEEYSIKTIVIGNEEEIKKMYSSQNLVSKYNLVKDLELPIEERDSKSRLGHSNQKPEYPISSNNVIVKTDKATLEKQVEYLFPEPTDYETIKEKLVSFTVEFHPELESVFDKLAENKLNKTKIKRIVSLYESKHYYNIRTFLFSLEMLEKVNHVLNNLELKNSQAVSDKIIDAIFLLSVLNKDQRLDIKNSIFDYDFTFENKLSKETNQLLESEVNRFLSTSLINEEKLMKIFTIIDGEISNYYSKQNDSLEELQTFWLQFSDSDLKSRMSRTIQKVYKSSISPSVYKQLIHYIYFYNEIFTGEEINSNDVVDNLVKIISSAEGYINPDDHFHSPVNISNQDSIDKISEYFSKIHQEIDNHNKKISIHIGNTQKGNNDWLMEILDYEQKIRVNSFGDKKSVIGYLNITSILESIKKCSIEELNKFYYDILKKIYSFSNIGDVYPKDLIAVVELIKGLTQIKNDFVEEKGRKVFVYVLGQIIDFLNREILPSLQRVASDL